jgi:citrate lyase beta subunit
MASEEVGALRALSRHLAKRGDSAEGLLARVRASGEPVTFGALYRLLASESGFKLPPSSVTLLAHTLGEEITERQLRAVLAVVDTVEGVGSGSPSDAAWARVTLALAAADLSEAAWRKPFAAARAEAADGDDVSFWSFSKVLPPFLLLLCTRDMGP